LFFFLLLVVLACFCGEDGLLGGIGGGCGFGDNDSLLFFFLLLVILFCNCGGIGGIGDNC